jgi:hypothetical protein
MIITDKNPQCVFFALTDEDLRKVANLNDGANITSMTKFKGGCFGIKTLDTRWSSYSRTSLWHPEKINGLGEDGKFIIGMMKYDKLWTVFTAENTGITSQEIAVFDNLLDLKNHIKDQWARGMNITDLYNDEGNYYIVTSSGLGWMQSAVIHPYPEEEITKKAHEMSFITEIMPLENYHNLWIFSANTGYTEAHIGFARTNENIASIHKKLYSEEGYDGYRATLVRSVLGKLFFVLMK